MEKKTTSPPNPSNLHKVDDFDQAYSLARDARGWRSELRSWLRRKRSKFTCKRLLLSNFPIFNSFRGYRPLKDLPGDVISGLTVGVMHIPQGMAFAALATLPPIVGLYVAFVSCIVYFFIGGSRQASMGVIAVVCLMLGSVLDRELIPEVIPAVSDVAENVTSSTPASTSPTILTSQADLDARKIQLAAAVSFVCGLFLMVLGKLGFGFVTTYMPDALIRGFTTGAATHVAVSQMSNVLGVKIPRHNGALKAILTTVDLCKHLPDANWVPVVISLVSMVIMYVIRIQVNQRFSKKLKIPIPIELIVMILSIVISKYCYLHENFSLRIVGDIPTGVPKPDLPDLRLAKNYISDALVIGVVAFAQSVALAKTFAIKNGYKVDANQEMFAYGVSTVASSCFSGMVAAASMARSIVQDATGGKTQIASLIGSVIVLLVIMFLGPLFYSLPVCILSSVIIVNLRGMFRQFLLLKPYWRQSKADFILFMSTYLATVVLDVDIGLGVGVGVAVFSVVVRTQTASFSELGDVDDLSVFKPVSKYNKAYTNSTTRIVKFSSPLYFANTEMFHNKIYKLLGVNLHRLKKEKMARGKEISLESIPATTVNDNQGVPDDVSTNGSAAWSTSSPSNLSHVILDLSGTTFIDTMGASELKQVITDLKLVDIDMYVVGLPESCYHVLRTTDVWKKCSDHFYLSINDVLNDISGSTYTVHL